MIFRLFVRYWKTITIVLFLVITYYSIYPLPELPPVVPTNDKLHHVVSYAVLAFPVSLVRPKGYLYILMGFALWSGAIEVLQPYVNRYGEWADFYANSAGIVIGYLVARIFAKWIKP